MTLVKFVWTFLGTLQPIALGAVMHAQAKPTLTIEVKEKVVQLGKPFELRYTLTNPTQHALGCSSSFVGGVSLNMSYQYNLSSSGRMLSLRIPKDPLMPVDTLSFRDCVLKPGTSITENVLLDLQSFGVTTPGSFTFMMKKPSRSVEQEIDSNALVLTLAEKNK